MSAERTFRGLTLEEVEGQVRAELGPDAVIVRQREGLTGGVGGFFQRRCFEVDARAGDGGTGGVAAPPALAPPALDATAAAAFQRHLQAAQAARPPAPAQPAFVPEPMLAPAPSAAPSSADAAALAALFTPDVPRREPDWAAVEWFAPATGAASSPVALADPPAAEPDAFFAARTTVPEFVPEPPMPMPAPMPAAAAPSAPLWTPVEPAPAPVAAVVPAAPAPGTALHARWPTEAAPVHGALLARGVSPELAAELLDETVTHLLPFSTPGRLQPLVAGALARRIPVQPLRGAGGRVVGFVGPGGAGKTRCVARLAHAYAVRSSMTVSCVSLRPEDGGAELQRLLSPHGVPVHAVHDGREARERISRLRGEGLVVVDTPGVSPRAEAELRVLAAELRQLALDECHLAVPATMGRDAARELVEGTRALGVDALALTHADETELLGTVVECAIHSGLPLSYLGRGTIVTGGLRPAVADELAAALTA